MHCFISFSVVGFHNWPTAPNRLRYLRDLHRHEFHVKVIFPQTEYRAIEFHEFAAACKSALLLIGHPSPFKTVPGRDFGARSCEQLAQELADQVRDNFGLDWVVAEVSEDEIFGASCTAYDETLLEEVSDGLLAEV